MRIALIIAVSLFWGSWSELKAAQNPAETRTQIRSLQRSIVGLRTEIKDLQSSVDSLEGIEGKMAAELVNHEGEMQEFLFKVGIPLLQWPEAHRVMYGNSWITIQRGSLVLGQLKQNLLRKPIEWRASHELRVREIQELRDELTSRLGNLVAKRDLLKVQAEELKSLERRQRAQAKVQAKPPQPESSKE